MAKTDDLTDRMAFGIKELTAVLPLSERSVWSLIQRGDLRTISVGRRRLVLRAEVERFLDTLVSEVK